MNKLTTTDVIHQDRVTMADFSRRARQAEELGDYIAARDFRMAAKWADQTAKRNEMKEQVNERIIY